MAVAPISNGRAITRSPIIENALGALAVYSGSPLEFCTTSACAGSASKPVVSARTTAVERNSFIRAILQLLGGSASNYNSALEIVSVTAVNRHEMRMRVFFGITAQG